MSTRFLGRALPGLMLALTPLSGAAAHEIAGNRFFPATLTIDDPGVNDEFSMPTFQVTKSGDEPPIKQLDFSSEYSKRITEAFAISVTPTWTRLFPPGGPNGAGAIGFQNLESTFKYRFYKDPVHELIMSVGLSVEWGGVGSEALGADKFNTYTPTFFFGKGFGDLPEQLSWARPLALTGTVGYTFPGRSHNNDDGRSGYRRGQHRRRAYSAVPQLGPVAAIQHAVPQIGGA